MRTTRKKGQALARLCSVFRDEEDFRTIFVHWPHAVSHIAPTTAEFPLSNRSRHTLPHSRNSPKIPIPLLAKGRCLPDGLRIGETGNSDPVMEASRTETGGFSAPTASSIHYRTYRHPSRNCPLPTRFPEEKGEGTGWPQLGSSWRSSTISLQNVHGSVN